MKIFRISVTNIIAVIVICISFIPIYNRYFTHQREGRFDFNINTLFLEYFLVLILFVLLLGSKTLFRKNLHYPKVKYLTIFIIIYIILTFFSVLLSQEFSRSLKLFAFGSVGPLLIYLIIVFKTPANFKVLTILIKSLLLSSFLYLIIAYLFAFRFGITADLLETRSGKNIYGSNAVIGSISFVLPLIFMNINKTNKIIQNKFFLRTFTILSIVWIIISLSRWGYATAILSYIIVAFFINKSISIKTLLLFFALFGFLIYLIPGVTELIIFRFTGSTSTDSFTMDNILNVTSGEGRLVRWENALSNVIWKNPLFGIGIGNNYLVDPFGSSDAHNLFVNLLIEQGILPFIALMFVFISIYRLVRKLALSTSQELNTLVLSLGIGILMFHFWSLTGGTYIQSSGIISAVKNYYFFIVLGLIGLISRIDEAEGSPYLKN